MKKSMSFSKMISKSIASGLQFLPQSARNYLIRQRIQVTESPENVIFKQAETKDELQQAYEIVYQGYLAKNLISQNDLKMRITKFQLLPSTHVMIAKKDSEVIATYSMVVDSALGLPCESSWDLTNIRKNSNRIAEISNLCIKKEYQKLSGKLLLPLIKMIYMSMFDHLGVDLMIAVVHPEASDFYKSILLFEEKKEYKTVDCKHVNGAKGSFLTTRMDQKVKERFKTVFDDQKDSRNIYKYIFQTKLDSILLPAKSDLAAVGRFDMDTLKNSYSLYKKLSTDLFEKIFSDEFVSAARNVHDRLPVNIKCRLFNSAQIDEIAVLNISTSGMKIKWPNISKRDIGEKCHFQIFSRSGHIFKVSGIVRWQSHLGTCGIEFTNVSQAHEFNNYIQSLLLSYTGTDLIIDNKQLLRVV